MPDRPFPQAPVYAAPEGLRVYAIGDVHGCLRQLEAMHKAIAADLQENPPEAAHIIYLGDYVDRGPDSRGVLDFLIAQRDRQDGIARTFILGNHEQGLFEFLERPAHEIWTEWGGLQTLESYGLAPPPILLPAVKAELSRAFAACLPSAHLEFLQSLQTHIVIGDYIFAHAGIDPRKTLDEQKVSDFTFIRVPFLDWPDPLPLKVVHGHTICPEPENLPHRICVDTGAYKGGPLSCVVLEDTAVRFLQVK